MNLKKQLSVPLILMGLSMLSSATVYSNGEDGTLGNWNVRDNKPSGAVITNVFDREQNSNVIVFKGDKRRNSYQLGDRDWNNKTEKNLKWSMNFSEKYKITVFLKTKKGTRTVFYTYKNTSKGLYKKRYIQIGLGESTKSGTWKDISRNLEADLKKYEPDNSVIKVRGMKVQGSGRIDDIRLEKEGNHSCITREALDTKIENNEDVTQVNTSCIKNMKSLFHGQEQFNQDISNWDVSNVTNMDMMFAEAESFNQDISKWDVSKVTNMHNMFLFAEKFSKQDLHKWNVKNVSNHEEFFENAGKGNIEPKWAIPSKNACISRNDLYTKIKNHEDVTNVNTSCIEDMSNLFSDKDFNQDIGNWDVSNVQDMEDMFRNASKFNQDLSRWDISNVTDVSGMFYGAKNFKNQDLSNWNTKKVKEYGSFLDNAGKNNIPPKFVCLNRHDLDLKIQQNEDITNVNVSCIENMSGLFESTDFNQDISSWDVSHVTNMSRMFSGNSKFNQDISKWDVEGVTNMNAMFEEATAFNQDLGSWDVSNVTDMSYMFASATAFNQDIGNWNISKVTTLKEMFLDATAFNQDIGKWNVSNVKTMNGMFVDATIFNQDISKWDVSNVNDMSNMFLNAESFTNHDLSKWQVKNVHSNRNFLENAGENNIQPKWVK